MLRVYYLCIEQVVRTIVAGDDRYGAMSNKLDSKTDPGKEPRPKAGGSSKEKAIDTGCSPSPAGHSSSITGRGTGAFSHKPTVYQIRLQGHLGDQWADWFGGLTITLEEDGHTLLTGPVADQAALFGLLRKVRDLGLPLLSVNRVETGPSMRLSLRGLGTGQADASKKGGEE